MGELKPCPFCGGEARIESSDGKLDKLYIGYSYDRKEIKGFSHYWNVHCGKCASSGYNYRQFFSVDENSGKIVLYEDGRKKAIEAWNRRVTDENTGDK